MAPFENSLTVLVFPLEKRLTLNEHAYVYFTHDFLGFTHAVFNDDGHTHFSSVSLGLDWMTFKLWRVFLLS